MSKPEKRATDFCLQLRFHGIGIFQYPQLSTPGTWRRIEFRDLLHPKCVVTVTKLVNDSSPMLSVGILERCAPIYSLDRPERRIEGHPRHFPNQDAFLSTISYWFNSKSKAEALTGNLHIVHSQVC
jgi:hypothetical protein